MYTQISLQLGFQQVRAVKDIRTIVSAYDKLAVTDENIQCVNKVLAENSVSQACKIVCSLNYISQKDKRLYLENKIAASRMYECRKSNAVSCEELTSEQMLEKRAKQLKDDTEIPLTVEMVAGMFDSATCNYLDTVLTYVDMARQIKDKSYSCSEAINKVIIGADMVNKAITSLKEVLINNNMEVKSNE